MPVERTLNHAFDQHPARLTIRQGGGESFVDCGTTRAYRTPTTGDRPDTPADRWLVETFLHVEA